MIGQRMWAVVIAEKAQERVKETLTSANENRPIVLQSWAKHLK
jgi:hypothetical protein